MKCDCALVDVVEVQVDVSAWECSSDDFCGSKRVGCEMAR